MTDEQLKGRAAELQIASRQIKTPLIPDAAKEAIQGAADIIAELVKREVERNASSE